MKARAPVFAPLGCVVVLAAWFVQVPKSVQADEIPEKYRETVRKGLEFLVKNQHKDGHWEGDKGQHPVAMTGLVGLALLMNGGSIEKLTTADGWEVGEKYKKNVRKAVEWLVNKSQARRDGMIFSGHPSETARYMQGHGLSTLFLAGAYSKEKTGEQEKIGDVVSRAVEYIVKARSSQGGWYATSRVEGHDLDTVLDTVIQIQALQAARHAGFPVPDEVISDGQKYLRQAIDKHATAKAPSAGRLIETAAALGCRYDMIDYSISMTILEDQSSQQWFKYCEATIPKGAQVKFGRDELVHYYYAQYLLTRGRDTWADYRTVMFDRLKSTQDKDGGWPAADGISAGPVYATALWCTILQLDKRNHPSSRFLTERQ